jgi:protein-L-isoaspartate(D-aspartate) O-methyltransferase
VDPERAQKLRAEMVRRQLRDRGVHDETVLAAMAAVPREHFLPPELAEVAYSDGALPIEAGQTISQPYIVALMTELLAPHAGMRILEIGTGSGYQAAILAHLGCDVLSIERHPELAASARSRLAGLGLADRVRIEIGDGSIGWRPLAPYEGIVVTAAAPNVPAPLRRQLADGGRLVIPIGPLGGQELMAVTRRGEGFEERSFGRCGFVPLIGAAAFNEESLKRARRPWSRPFHGGRL